jgi:hypothetical protein
MRTLGFSTGALAYADFRRGLAMLHGKPVHAVELSALRQPELLPLSLSIGSLDLTQFSYVAIHAPSSFPAQDEASVVQLLHSLHRRGWPIVLHPDAIFDYSLWRRFGPGLLIENMDRRKPIGRTVPELTSVFDQLPDASFCFDIGHARQVDPTMTVAYFLLKQFAPRLRQLHLSEVNSRSSHDPLSYASILAFSEVADLIPEQIPVILETPVPQDQIIAEMDKAARALSPDQRNLAIAG